MEIETEVQPKRVIFSAIQPSDTIALGNYLGAIKNWVTMQEDYRYIFASADLHTITVRQDPVTFCRHTLEAYALFLACGINPQEHPFPLQSHVHTHAELAWILNCYTQFGEPSRMTQFKNKSAKHADNINAGLFTYPSLMTADILLYRLNLVSVGADQKQHLELARSIAERFSGVYSPTFTMPEPYVPKVGARIMSLQDPVHRMSKSGENANAYVAVLDKPDDIMRRFKRAITDSGVKVHSTPNRDGVNNLMGVYFSVTGLTNEQIEAEFEDKGYGDFKLRIIEAVSEELRPVQERYERLIADKTYLEQCYTEGVQQAPVISTRILNKVMKEIDFLSKRF